MGLFRLRVRSHKHLRFPTEILGWVKRMRRHEHTRCILHNLFSREARFCHVADDMLQSFFDRLGNLINGSGYPNEPIALARTVCDDTPPLILQGAKVPECQLVSPRDISLSRVVTAFDILKFHGGALGLEYQRDHTEQFVATQIQTGKLRGEHLTKTWRGMRPMCWVTKTEALDNLRSHLSSPDLGTKVRNKLGLKGLEDKFVHLIEIRYPSDFINNESVRVPTVLDGGDCIYFRPHKETDGWGRTVDLDTLEAGFPEAVHGETAVASDFKLYYLGKITEYSPGFPFRQLLRKSREMLK